MEEETKEEVELATEVDEEATKSCEKCGDTCSCEAPTEEVAAE